MGDSVGDSVGSLVGDAVGAHDFVGDSVGAAVGGSIRERPRRRQTGLRGAAAAAPGMISSFALAGAGGGTGGAEKTVRVAVATRVAVLRALTGARRSLPEFPEARPATTQGGAGPSAKRAGDWQLASTPQAACISRPGGAVGLSVSTPLGLAVGAPVGRPVGAAVGLVVVPAPGHARVGIVAGGGAPAHKAAGTAPAPATVAGAPAVARGRRCPRLAGLTRKKQFRCRVILSSPPVKIIRIVDC